MKTDPIRAIRFAQSQARIAHIAGQDADERAWLDMCALLERHESEGWASYAAEQERHAETARRLEDMTREARLSRESTEKAVQRLENLRNEIARLHDVYAVAPNEPRCCSDCAALDISDELRMVLRNA